MRRDLQMEAVAIGQGVDSWDRQTGGRKVELAPQPAPPESNRTSGGHRDRAGVSGRRPGLAPPAPEPARRAHIPDAEDRLSLVQSRSGSAGGLLRPGARRGRTRAVRFLRRAQLESRPTDRRCMTATTVLRRGPGSPVARAIRRSVDSSRGRVAAAASSECGYGRSGRSRLLESSRQGMPRPRRNSTTSVRVTSMRGRTYRGRPPSPSVTG